MTTSKISVFPSELNVGDIIIEEPYSALVEYEPEEVEDGLYHVETPLGTLRLDEEFPCHIIRNTSSV